jgi:hypothetical protein
MRDCSSPKKVNSNKVISIVDNKNVRVNNVRVDNVRVDNVRVTDVEFCPQSFAPPSDRKRRKRHKRPQATQASKPGVRTLGTQPPQVASQEL